MIYVDTSVIVSALTSEQATSVSQRWLWTHPPGEIGISDWTVTEFSAALSVKVRVGTLKPEARVSVLAEFARISAAYFLLLEITNAIFQRAARLCDRVESGLRASDALHLAVAELQGLAICTLDGRLARVAETLGVKSMRPA
jgi:predicted nucleic acid-binding protein